MILKQTLLSASALLLDDHLIAPQPGINTPYTLILFIRSLQSTSLLPRGEIFFHFNLIVNSTQILTIEFITRQVFHSQKYSKANSKLVFVKFPQLLLEKTPRQFQNLSLPNFLITSTEIFSANLKTCLSRKFCYSEPTYLLSICPPNDSIGSLPSLPGHVTIRLKIPCAQP